MDTKEIIDSGFFYAFISRYVDHYVTYHYNDHDRLIYTMCNSDEEKDIATREEMAKIKKKIFKAGYEYISMYFISQYSEKRPVDYSKEENHSDFWVKYFHEFFISEFEGSLTPYTDANSLIDKLPENPKSDNVDAETMAAVDLISTERRNTEFLAECESDIIYQIEADIDYYNEKGYWEIEHYFYETYVRHSRALKLLFKLCKLLVQLHRYKMFESFIGLKTEEYIRNPINERLKEYGFFQLPMVEKIPNEKLSRLIDFIHINKLPYKIALLNYLGFIKHMEKEHFKTKYKLYIELAKWFNTHQRAIKGNLSSLLPNSTEDKNRYTAYSYKKVVEENYSSLLK